MIIYMFNMLKLGPHTYGSYLVLIIEDVISTACLNAENRTAKFKGLWVVKNKLAVHIPLGLRISYSVFQSFTFGILLKCIVCDLFWKSWVLHWFYSRITVHPASELLSWVSEISKIACQVLTTSCIIPDQTLPPVYYSTTNWIE